MSTIDEVKQKLDITEVVGSYVTLKKAGRNLTACCPFHSEKTPSFFVFPEKQSWHCFGACNTGGDVFAFVMKKEAVEFGEALRLLAQRAGVVLPARPEPGIPKEEKEEYFNANEAAALYYHNLLINSPAAVKAKSYAAKRGLTAKTISDFQLGYSLDSWDALKTYLMEKGHTEKTLVTAGLLYQDDKGNTHDRFRNKLMIPIKDARGRVTGFGSRVLDDSLPKYINSPQSPTFDKSGTLYAIDRAAVEIRKKEAVILMEGYMDVIIAHQYGVTNAVASMGTSLTENQLRILKRTSKEVKIYLCFDADLAGLEASERGGITATTPLSEQTALRLSTKHNSSSLTLNENDVRNAEVTGIRIISEEALNIDVRVVLLPEGKDPDEVIINDINVWYDLVDQAIPYMDFLIGKTSKPLNLTNAIDKSVLVNKLVPIFASIGDPIRQAHYLQKLAALVKVDMNTIQMSLNQLKQPGKKHRVTTDKTAVKAGRPLVSHAREEYLLTLLLQNPEYKSMEENISIYIENSANREIYRYWQEAADLADLKERLDPAIHEHMDAILGKKLPPGLRNDIEQRILDCISELKRTYLKNMAARRSESGETETGTPGMEEDVTISQRLRDLDITRAKKQNASFGRRR